MCIRDRKLFRGEKAIPGPLPKAISRGTDVVVDTSRSSKNTICEGETDERVSLISGTQKVSHEKNSQAMHDEPTGKKIFPHVKNMEEIFVHPLGRQNFSHGKKRQEILADSSGRQKFPHKKSRQEIPIDLSGSHNLPRGKNRQDIPVDPCLLYTSPSPRDATLSRMPSSA